MTPIETRIQRCRALWQAAADPDTCLRYWYELAGLRVAAGQIAPPDLLSDSPPVLIAAYRRGLEDGALLRDLEHRCAEVA